MPYPEMMVAPMRQELTQFGVKELTTAEEVDQFMQNQQGTAMIVINSVCGCAAGAARPAVSLALQNDKRPETVVSVFAGQDTDATQRAREYFPQLPPSSPSLILLKDGQLVEYIPRHQIEGRDANAIAEDIVGVIDKIGA